ncbi:Cellulase-8, endo-1,4-beta-glucanase, partial [Globisporangium splendens]
MKSFVVAFVAGVTALVASVLANEHPYTLPQFPAGDPIPADTSVTSKLLGLAAVTPQATLNFQAKLDGIYMNGAPFTFKGANYFGMEGDILVPHGLWGGGESTTIQKIATYLKANNFNAVRLPFAVDAVLQNKVVDRTKIINEAALQTSFNGKTLYYLDVMDYTISIFAANKIVVLLDAHVLYQNGGIGALWYTNDADKNNFENAWKILATRYKNTWNVIGADLKNEPHDSASWGSNNTANDWRLASSQWAKSILSITPRWLIFIEGMQYSSRDQAAYPCFWGENLMDLQRANLTLPVTERLVYSPHVYGPNVAYQSYFSASNYPNNMPAIWDLHFGFVHKKYGPIVMGEWGGKYRDDADKKWQDRFAAYLKEKGLGYFYWSLNPNSGDTEGLLENDWNTPRYDKLTMLSGIKGTPIP